MLGALGTLPNIKQLKQFSQQSPWMDKTVMFLDTRFNDKSVQRDDPFLVYLQDTAGKAARAEISLQLSHHIQLIAQADEPVLLAREWVLQLTDEYAPLLVLTSEGDQVGEQVNFVGLRPHTVKVIVSSYSQLLEDDTDLTTAYNALRVRMLRLKFDLSIAIFVLDCLTPGSNSKHEFAQSILTEYACAYHSARLCQAGGIAAVYTAEELISAYRQKQSLFLEGKSL
ncbi:MAG: hypothetical protein QM500_09730 [Methylococcales bacterium]